MIAHAEPKIWFPTIRAGTGADVFTLRLCAAIESLGIRAEITWLPHQAEYLPWMVEVPQPPSWANIIHVNTWLHRRFVPARLPMVATMHHVVHDEHFAPFKNTLQSLYHRLWIKPTERRNLARASRITSVSHYTAQQLRHCFNVTDATVIHNGVDLSTFLPPSRLRPHTPFRLLYVGSWQDRKGTDLLVPIMEQLGAGFELCYTGPLRPMPPNCRSLGRLDTAALVMAYGQSDALLFPSRLEGFGQVAAEAMACGLPVIAGRNSALPEVVAHQRTGLLVEQEDVQGYTDAIRALCADNDRWLQMSMASRRRAEEHFDIDRMAHAYARLYRGLIEQENADDE